MDQANGGEIPPRRPVKLRVSAIGTVRLAVVLGSPVCSSAHRTRRRLDPATAAVLHFLHVAEPGGRAVLLHCKEPQARHVGGSDDLVCFEHLRRGELHIALRQGGRERTSMILLSVNTGRAMLDTWHSVIRVQYYYIV